MALQGFQNTNLRGTAMGYNRYHGDLLHDKFLVLKTEICPNEKVHNVQYNVVNSLIRISISFKYE